MSDLFHFTKGGLAYVDATPALHRKWWLYDSKADAAFSLYVMRMLLDTSDCVLMVQSIVPDKWSISVYKKQRLKRDYVGEAAHIRYQYDLQKYIT